MTPSVACSDRPCTARDSLVLGFSLPMKNVITACLLLLSVLYSQAEEASDWEKYFELYAESENLSASEMESTYEYLYALEANPINLNTATREELEALPFLSDRNVEDILEYIDRHGAVKSMGEMALLSSIDYNQRQLLAVFTYAGEERRRLFPKLNDIIKHGKANALVTAKVPFYERKGDKNGYLGYQYKHSVQLDYTYGDCLRLGVLGSQDAGEPFFAGKNSMGYDFYSFYLVLKKLGRLKALALGRYRVKFGMGLVVNSNYSFGKLSALTSMQSAAGNLRAHASRSDANYMQGAAATVSVIKGLDVSAFFSYRKFDATLNDDGTIATILSSGYHRTETEMSKKNNSANMTAGGNLSFRRNGFHVGATAVYTALDRDLRPNTTAYYRRHRPSGRRFFNIGADYGYTGHRLSFSGETATGACHAVATINMLTYGLTEHLDLTALYRYYSYKYYALLGNSFSDNGSVQNESGAYLGVSWRPQPSLNVMAYADYAYFTWPRYQTSQSSASFEGFAQATWSPGEWMLTARYRLKVRQRDNKEKTALINKTEHRGRLSAAFNGERWRFRTQADAVLSSFNERSVGWMLTQSAGCAVSRWLRVDASAGYFDTDSYDSRVYSYERGLRYASFFSAFYGQGIRCSLLASAELAKQLSVTAKLGTTKYFDRSVISSGYNQIDGSAATDLEIQLRLKL